MPCDETIDLNTKVENLDVQLADKNLYPIKLKLTDGQKIKILSSIWFKDLMKEKKGKFLTLLCSQIL